MTSEDGKLDKCGCCQGIKTRKARYNRPGLPSIEYRLDTHSGFFKRSLAKLHLQKVSDDSQPLRDLTTRSKDDFAIALLDAWSMMADVITFYQERAANEGFLRTLQERVSALEMARAIGYELKPGVAASVHLAFTMEDSQNSPKISLVPKGLAVKSIPPPGKLPQTFETAEEMEARVEWNALLPLLTKEQRVGNGSTYILLEGLDTSLQPGDAVLFVASVDDNDYESKAWQMRILTSVTADPESSSTLVTWDVPLDGLGETEDASFVNPMVFAMRERPDLDRSSQDKGKIDLEGTYPGILPGSWVAMTLHEGLYRVMNVSLMSVERIVEVPGSGDDPPMEFKSKVKITRIDPDTAQNLSEFSELKTAVFAQSEPLNPARQKREGLIEGDSIELDRAVYGLNPGKTLIVSGRFMRGQVEADGLKLVSSKDVEKTLYRDDSLQILKPPETIKLLWTLKDENGLTGTVIANIGDIAYLSSSDLEDEGSTAQVEVKVDGLKLIVPQGENRDLIKGEVLLATALPEKVLLRWTLRDGDGFEGVVTVPVGVISLQPALDEDSKVSEVVTLSGTDRSGGRTVLSLKEAMKYCYDPNTFLVYANIARATHGETTEEVLGSGDGSKSNQRFELSKPYLTYVSAPTSTGAKSTLEVRVNGVLWEELPSLYGMDERRQSYVVRIDDDALAAIIFGDGKSGARLPTGDENVTTTYRSGIGPEGEVAIESLTLLQSRPLGISEVTNPLPSTGAAPPEELSDARYNAPLTVLTLDRIVSLRDFEYFVRSFAGIGKAQAISISQGQSKVVHITIASSSGSCVDRGSDLFSNLVKAIDAMRDPVARVRERVIVDSFLLQTFSIEAGLLIDPRYLAKEVLARAEADLRRSFSFENRNFAQFVTAAEVLAVIQAVEGVIAVDLDRLERDDAPKA
ncbi:MAG: hypothetical protein PHS80_01300, partial [Methanothrix sp.]|nr:hypothetical protein [Methanothrix sp.]